MIVRTKPPIDSRIERQILTGMIVSDRFNQLIKPILRDDVFQCSYGAIIGNWCKDYHTKYNKAPGKNIQDIFLNNSHSLTDTDSEAIKQFLASISDEYVRADVFNIDYILDQAENHFRLSSLQKLKSEIDTSIISGNPEDGENLVNHYVRPARPTSKGVDSFRDLTAILDAFNAEKTDTLFSLPGVLGKEVGKIGRGQLASILGQGGIGKTWWLLLLSRIAIFRGLNVTLFSFEMPEKQITKRIQQMITGRPKKDYPEGILIPVFDCLKNQMGYCNKPERTNQVQLWEPKKQYFPSFEDSPPSYRVCTSCRGNPEWEQANWFVHKNIDKINNDYIIEKNKSLQTMFARAGNFHIYAAPSGSMSVTDIRAYLKNRIFYEGVVPDVIITDSADKMRADGKHDQHRHGINSIWMGHKALAEEFHSAVITVSHSNTERSQKRIKQGDWAEDVRKFREIDMGWSINQTPEEKKAGYYVCSTLKQRDDDFDLSKEIEVLCCLKIGQAYLDSAYKRKDEEALKGMGK